MKYWIWYSLLETLSVVKKKKLLDIYCTPEKIFNIKIEELANIKFINQSNIDELINNRDLKLISRYEEYMLKNNIKMININDAKYPRKLKNIYDPPITLFAKGNLDLLDNTSIAVIGCREASIYGLNIAEKMSYELALKNIVIVSGMAKGIDGMAHIGCLKANGGTIAVLGSGVDYPYPYENISIYKDIISKNGLILSEYIVGTKPNSKNFPKRNRIISALSEGLLVIEAKKKSGTMITVDFALEQGKNIYVLPGNVNSKNSEGTNNLIKQGAKLVSDTNDILEDFCSYLHFNPNII